MGNQNKCLQSEDSEDEILQSSQVTQEDLFKLKKENAEKTDLLDFLMKHEIEKQELEKLAESWKNGGLQAAELLASKLNPTKTVKDLLIQLGLPPRTYLVDN